MKIVVWYRYISKLHTLSFFECIDQVEEMAFLHEKLWHFSKIGILDVATVKFRQGDASRVSFIRVFTALKSKVCTCPAYLLSGTV
jgi:hypothetical protein